MWGADCETEHASRENIFEHQVTASLLKSNPTGTWSRVVDGTLESDFLKQRRRDQTRTLQSNGGINHKRKVKENVATTGEA